jgi:hypothetical protein
VPQDQLNFPTRLNAKLAGLTSVVASADAAPTQQSYEVFHELTTRIDQQLIALQEVIDQDVAAFSELVRTSGVPVIVAGATPKNAAGTQP